jgi:hypothetical protein
VRALFWPLFARSAWTQPATVVAGTTGEGYPLASGRLVGVESASHSEIVLVAGSRPCSLRADCMRQVRRANCRIGPRTKADGCDVAMSVKHFCRAEDRPVFSTFSCPTQVPDEPS